MVDDQVTSYNTQRDVRQVKCLVTRRQVTQWQDQLNLVLGD